MKKYGIAAVIVLVCQTTAIWSQPYLDHAAGIESSIPYDQQETNLFLENESRFNFDETVERIKLAFEQKTWKISAVHDLQLTLKSNGMEVLPIKVFAVCHPALSGKLLARDEARIISPMMPCRVSVYQKSDGKTYVSRMNPENLAKAYGGLIEEVMMASFTEVEEILQDLLLTP